MKSQRNLKFALGLASNCSLEEISALRTLDLSDNDLGDLDADRFQALCGALAGCAQLQTLDLPNNKLGDLNDDLFSALINALSQSKTLLQIKTNEILLDRANQLRSICQRNHTDLIDRITATSEQVLGWCSTYHDWSDDVRLLILSHAFKNTSSLLLQKVDQNVKNIVSKKRRLQ